MQNNLTIREFQDEFRFLSNFWRVDIKFGGITYPSTEHAYQAAKFNSEKLKRKIVNMPSPGEAKRAVKFFSIRDDWNQVKLNVMLSVNRIKYLSDFTLARKLIATGEVDLIEGNRWNDTFWGVCNGVGENHLGKILMQIRTELFELGL